MDETGEEYMIQTWKRFNVVVITICCILLASQICMSMEVCIIHKNRSDIETELVYLNGYSFNGTLSGFVMDTALNPIGDARVRVSFHGTYEEDVTDSSGFYSITNIPLCYCLKNVTVSKLGYLSEWVLLSIGENTTYDFVLTSNAFESDCGDVNRDGMINVSDIVFLINYIFNGGMPPDPLCLGDAGGDFSVSIDDVVWLINYVFIPESPSPVRWCCNPPGEWVSYGPFEGGGPEVLLSDPTNCELVYVGNNGGSGLPEGLFKSQNTGDTWEMLVSGACYAAMLDPNKPEILYAGVGNELLKSYDGGNSWIALQAEHLDPYFSACKFIDITIDPNNNQTVYACGLDLLHGYFLYVSYDGGATWQSLLHYLVNPGVRQVIVDPLDSEIVYGRVQGSGIYLSINGGTSWSWMNEGLTDVAVLDISAGVSRINNVECAVVYCATLSNGVFQSVNGGSWSEKNMGLTSLQVSSIVVTHDDALHVYVGTRDGVFQSVTGGDEWSGLGELPVYHFDSAGEPVDRWVIGLEISAGDRERLFASHFDVVYSSIDAGVSWEVMGLPITLITEVMVSPFDTNNIFCGAMFGYCALYKSNTGGSEWQGWVPPDIPLGDISAIAFHPGDPDVIYLGSYNNGGGFFRSEDGGESWLYLVAGLDDMFDRCVEEIAVDQLNDNIVYIGTLNGVYKSIDGGFTWSETGLTSEGIHVVSLMVHPLDSEVIFAGTYGNGVFKSTNGGVTWVEVDVSFSDGHIMDIVCDSDNPDSIYIADTEYGVFKSINLGETWFSINSGMPNVPVRALEILGRENESSVLFAGTWGEGVYLSDDGGMSWELIPPTGMRVTHISSVAVSDKKEGIVLYAGSYGGGIYQTILDI